MANEAARSGGLIAIAAASLLAMSGCSSAERGASSQPPSLGADCSRAVAAGAHLDSSLRTIHADSDPSSRKVSLAAAVQTLEIANASLHDSRLTNLGQAILVHLAEALSAATRGESTPFDYADFERMWDQTIVSTCGAHTARLDGAQPF
ncbi:hypothetical protein ACPPVQ_00665 [Diaminobutyricibacter sp. McL0618]|uniref:hypothetical protein n=1 Tax=Leifsonia sp. McL0618 TaxID=3415677 RepID=UPI003CEC1D3C